MAEPKKGEAMFEPRDLSLSKGEMAVLPLLPVLLAARAEGYPCEATREQVFQAMVALDIDLEGVDVVSRILSRRPTQRDTDLLMALGVLAGKREISCDVARILCWAVRVLANWRSCLTGRQAAMLVMILRGLGRSCSPRAVARITKSQGIRVILPNVEEYREAMGAIFSPTDSTVDESEWPAHDYAKGRIINSLPVLGIPKTIPYLAKSPNPFPNCFLKMLAGSISLSVADKQTVIEKIKRLSQFQIDELMAIWVDERNKLAKATVRGVFYPERTAAIRWLKLYRDLVPQTYLKEPWLDGW